MYPIKQSTAITVPFFVHDAAGDAVTGLTDGSFTKRISKNGGAFAAMTVTITEMENGWYSIPLSTAHSDTLGLLTIVFTNAGAKQVNLQVRVTAKLTDDLNDVAATDIVSAGAITTLAGAVVNVDTVDTASSVTAAVTVGTINANVITASSIAASALDGKGDWNVGKTGYALSAAGVDAILDETLTAHVTADSLGVAVKDILADTNELQSDDVPGLIAALNDPTAAVIADAVWDETLSAHLGAGSTGEALNNAGAAGDPWTTTLPGSYTGSQAGKMLSDVLTDTAEIGAAGAGLTEAGGTGDQFTALNDPTAAAIADAVWDELQAAHVAAGSFGEVAGEIADILADTNELQSDDVPALIAAVQSDTDDIQTRIPAALVGGRMDSTVEAIGNVVTSASRISRSTQGIVLGVVGVGSTNTNIVTSSLDPAATVQDQFKGRTVTFEQGTTTASLRGQSSDITGSTAGGGITVTALTNAPVSGDVFIIT